MIAFKFLLISTLSVLGSSAASVNGEPGQPVISRNEPIFNGTRIVYPSEDTNQKRRPTHNRPPIEDARICNESELLYPGDNEGDWVCDCKPGYLHYPLNGMCYEAYTQGPCKLDQILVLQSNRSSIPECIRNKCDSGKVFFNGKCFALNDEEGCKHFTSFIGRKTLLVPDPSTLALTCADEDFRYACVNTCCIGSRREFRNICQTKRVKATTPAVKNIEE